MMSLRIDEPVHCSCTVSAPTREEEEHEEEEHQQVMKAKISAHCSHLLKSNKFILFHINVHAAPHLDGWMDR